MRNEEGVEEGVLSARTLPGPLEHVEGQSRTHAGSQPKAGRAFTPVISGDLQTGSPRGARPWLLPSQGQDRAPRFVVVPTAPEPDGAGREDKL